MIHIVTGRINSGKSTTIWDLYHHNRKGDGFVSVKRMHYNKVHGYDIMRLSTQETRLLVVREEYRNKEYNIACQIGPYQFIEETLNDVQAQIIDMIDRGIEPIYLDEIGQLELYDQCFHSIFQRMLDADVECYITVRKELIQDVIDKYHITNYNIIEV
jgi:nucleoside-triphosphatase THEP1